MNLSNIDQMTVWRTGIVLGLGVIQSSYVGANLPECLPVASWADNRIGGGITAVRIR